MDAKMGAQDKPRMIMRHKNRKIIRKTIRHNSRPLLTRKLAAAYNL